MPRILQPFNENDMKQTAVEWLIEHLTEIHPEAFKQAKAMEKEQIIRAHLMARCYDTENSVNEAEQYYNETYESND